MEDHAKLEKTLKMLMTLSSGRKYSVDELSERFDITERTVRRYFSTFRNVGFALQKKVGLYCITKIDEPFKQLSDLLYFSEEEAYILTKAIHSIDENNVLKQNLVEKLYSLYNFGKVAETIVSRDKSEVVHNLTIAIEQKKQVILRNYHSSNSELVRDRKVEPFAFTTNFISLWAFDPEDRKNKIFKTARIDKVDVTNIPYQFEEFHKQMPVDVFRISGENQIYVKLKLKLRAYNLLIEEYPLSEKFINQNDDTTYTFSANVCGFEGVGRFVAGLTNEIQIIEPVELIEFIKEKFKKFSN